MNPHTTKEALALRVRNMADRDIRIILEHPKITDWRNWGDNLQRQMAEEAHRRGILE